MRLIITDVLGSPAQTPIDKYPKWIKNLLGQDRHQKLQIVPNTAIRRGGTPWTFRAILTGSVKGY